MDLTEDQINKIILDYKTKQSRQREYYKTHLKDNETFKMKNRERAKANYEKNKQKRRDEYLASADLRKAKSLYHYYNKRDKLDVFKERHSERFDLLVEKGIVD